MHTSNSTHTVVAHGYMEYYKLGYTTVWVINLLISNIILRITKNIKYSWSSGLRIYLMMTTIVTTMVWWDPLYDHCSNCF